MGRVAALAKDQLNSPQVGTMVYSTTALFLCFIFKFN